jgi:hypothetical protein
MSEKQKIGQLGGPPPFSSSASSSSPAIQTTFACLQLSMTDRLRLINLPKSDIAAIESTIQTYWRNPSSWVGATGIQDIRSYGQAHELKMHGRPWTYTVSSENMAEPRRLVMRLLECLWDRGWIVKVATDVSSKPSDKDSILLRYQNPIPSKKLWMSLGFMQGDLLVISDPPPETSGSGFNFLGNLIRNLGDKVQRHRSLPNNSYEIKFKGYPWLANGEDAVKQRLLLIQLLEILEVHGWSLYTSVRIDSRPNAEQFSAADSWICQKDIDWAEGIPVYHP